MILKMDKKIVLVLLMALTVGISHSQWENLGEPGFSDGVAIYNNIKFHNNEAYVAFKDWSNNYGVSVKKFNGSEWDDIGVSGFSNTVGTFLDFVFHNNEAYVAYDDNDNSRIPTVMKFNGTTWETLPLPTTDTAYDINLASNNGNLYIAYKDFGAQFKATVKKFNGLTWDTIGSRGFTANGTFSLDLEFYNNLPYVSFIENAGLDENNHYVYKPSVMKFNGTDWVLVGNALFSPGSTSYTNLAFYQNQPCIAFRDHSNNERLAVMIFDGSDWIDLSSQDFTNDFASTPDLKVYNNELYVLYVTGGLGDSFARLKRFNGISWEYVGGSLVTDSVVFNTSLNFFNNELYVAMEDWGVSRKLTVKKYVELLSIDNHIKDEISIYPMPAKDILYIKNPNKLSINKVQVVNSQGRIVLELSDFTNPEINIEKLSSSIYSLLLYTNKGLSIKKIIKH